MTRYKATATVTFYVDADDTDTAIDIARQVADDLEPDRVIRYRHQPITAVSVSVCDDMADIDQLDRWKSEATAVIEQWESAWERLGRPGQLGQSKPDAVVELVSRLTRELILTQMRANSLNPSSAEGTPQ